MKMLGIDYGDRYVGFAGCDSEEILAYPLCAVKVKSMREAVDAAADMAIKESAEAIVIGLPLLPDGTEGLTPVRLSLLQQAAIRHLPSGRRVHMRWTGSSLTEPYT